MITTYTAAQFGYESPIGVFWWDGGNILVGVGSPGGAQFTVTAEHQAIFKSLTMNLEPVIGGGGAGTFTIGLVNDIDEAVFSATNYPSNQATIPMYSATHTFVVGTPVSVALTMGAEALQQGSFVGNFSTPCQVLHNSGFQGNAAFVFGFDGVTTHFSPPTLTSDEYPVLTGIGSSKNMLSRADWCPRCGETIFRERLVKDGYTGALVCPKCYDSPEHTRRAWVPPKEFNP